MPEPIRIGISSCLLGRKVRFDGGHKRDAFLVDTFGRFVEWVPVCPEVEAGLGIPREPIRLVRTSGGTRLEGTLTKTDHTHRMEAWAAARVEALAAEELCGFVLKKDSPSCGMERVRLYDHNGVPGRTGQGLFAAALLARFPLLPVEEEGRLSDPRLRDNFVERVFAHRRLRDLFRPGWRVGDLVKFHSAHKLAIMAHSNAAYLRMGRLVAESARLDREEVQRRYSEDLMTALAALATTRRHTNVLQHMAGYFKKSLDADSKAELHGAIEDYRLGLVPLIVPITLLRHFVRLHKVEYLAGQVYLEPHPRELMLRNHV